MDEPRVAIAASPREWAGRLHRHVADHGGAIVRATVLHPSDATVEDYDVLVVDDCTSFLSRRLVDDLHRRGRSVLGVYDPDDPRGKGDLLDAGADEVIERGASPEQFLLALKLLSARSRRPVDGELRELLATLRDGEAPPRTIGGPHAAAPPASARATPPVGAVTVVCGAGGGVGATEVAVALAAAAGRRGDATRLVDADEVAPAVAQRLALDPYPNIRAAVDALLQDAGDPAALLQAVPAGAFTVLPGLSSPDAWADLRAAEAGEIVRALAASCHHVIVNAGHRLEDLQGVGAPPRYAVSRRLVSLADRLLAVAAPTPVGVSRLLELLAAVRALTPATPVHVLFNRAPASGFKRGELTDELARSFAPAGVWFAPTDPRVEGAAWSGQLVPRGPFIRALDEVAAAVLPIGTPAAARGWRSVR